MGGELLPDKGLGHSEVAHDALLPAVDDGGAACQCLQLADLYPVLCLPCCEAYHLHAPVHDKSLPSEPPFPSAATSIAIVDDSGGARQRQEGARCFGAPPCAGGITQRRCQCQCPEPGRLAGG